MDIDRIKTEVESGRIQNLRRENWVEICYKNFSSSVLKEWRSMEDYLSVSIFGTDYAHLLKYSVKDNASVAKFSIRQNDFPYNIAGNVIHLVLWGERRLHRGEVEDVITSKITPSRSNLFWFEQDDEGKSVKGIWHVHIFYRAPAGDPILWKLPISGEIHG